MMKNKWHTRMAIYLTAAAGIHLLVLAYFLTVTLQAQGAATYYIWLGALFIFISLAVFIFQLIRTMVGPIDQIVRLLKDLNDGRYWQRVDLNEKVSVLHELGHHANQLAERLQKATEHEHIQTDRLQAVIRHMASGLLYIQRGRIVLTNERFLKMSGWRHDYRDCLYYEAPLSREVINTIQDVLNHDEEIKRHIRLGQHEKETLDIELFAAPVKHDEQTTGIVLVFHDITDLKQLEQTRKDFVANVSHELKTPVTSIKGFAETLLEGAMHTEQHLQHFLEIIHQESNRLDLLIQDLLDLSHIESKQLQLYWEKVDLNELIQDTLTLIHAKALDKKISVHFEPQGRAEIEGDPERLRQIFLNLLSNAIQYTPEQGRVDILIDQWQDKGYRVCVRDTGIGIKQEDIPRLFERFYRVDRARSRASGGTGLGLAIVKHLVEAHQGEISVQSEEGAGTEFCVSFHAERSR